MDTTTELMPLTLTVVRRVVLHTGEWGQVLVTLVGCGGTGSFLALHLARLAWHAREVHHLPIEMVFVDQDVVEPKNLGRQNFVPAEVGRPKAEALATRYSRAFGLEIRFLNEAFQFQMESNRWNALNLLVGCVDNASARRVMARVALGKGGRVWWLDCGNHDSSGQVLLGNCEAPAPVINPLGFCTALPLPSVQHPELLAESPKPNVSCADAALMDAQSLMVNQQVAGWAASYLYRMAISHDLNMYATYFDLSAGSARSEMIHAV